MMNKQHKLSLLLLSALLLLGSCTISWACEHERPSAPGGIEPVLQENQQPDTVQSFHEPIIRLEVAIESPDGILNPGTYYAHPLLTEQGFTELTLSMDNRVVTRFALRPAQSEPSPITADTGLPIIHTEANLTEDRKSVIFTVFEGPDRYVSAPFRVIASTTP